LFGFESLGDVAVKTFAKNRKGNRESGYGLVFAAFGLVVLLGAAGLSVDMGYLRYQRRLMQSAADSAALAGAAQLGAGAGLAAAQLAAQNDAGLNGFPQGGGVTITTTQTTINGNGNTLQVQINNSYPTFFMRILGNSFNTVNVSTTATAQYLGARGCIYALTGGGGINVTGNVNVPNCNVLSNQSISGGGSITAAAIGAFGSSSVTATPPAITGTLQASDPLSYLPGQATGAGCTDIDLDGTQNGKGAQTLGPGLYCEIVFEGAKGGGRRRGGTPAFNQNVTFRAGTYVITGGGAGVGGLSFHGAGTVSGTGVTFYVASGSISFGNRQTIQLTAPSVDPYAGILFFQPAANKNTATITGRGGSYLQGALYFPNATLTMNGAGNNPTSQYLLLVAKTLNLQTDISSTSNYSSLPNGSPIRSTALIQ
jgi:Flp pilus assembly protein TadG